MKKCSALALPSHHSPRVTRPPCELRPLCGLKSTQQILAVWIQKNKKDTKTLCGRRSKWSKLEHFTLDDHIYPFSSDRKNRTQVSGCHLVIGQAIIKVQQCSGQAKKTRAPLADEKSSRLGRKRLSSNQSRNDSRPNQNRLWPGRGFPHVFSALGRFRTMKRSRIFRQAATAHSSPSVWTATQPYRRCR